MLLSSAALREAVGTPVMHLRNVNPHVAAALADWARRSSQAASVPRQRTGLYSLLPCPITFWSPYDSPWQLITKTCCSPLVATNLGNLRLARSLAQKIETNPLLCVLDKAPNRSIAVEQARCMEDSMPASWQEPAPLA